MTLSAAGLATLSTQAAHADEVEPTADAPAAEGWRKTTLVEGLEHPWGMAFLPNGDMLVTERPGRLRRISNEELVDEPISGLPEVFASNQGGLFDVVLHPDFSDNQRIYFAYAAGDEDANRTMVARARLVADSLEDVQVLFAAEPEKSEGQHFGGRMLWLQDGTLLVSIGDGGNPPLEIDGIPAREHAQRRTSHLGSLIRINDDGSIPSDNPFIGEEGARPEIYSYGHRNVQGLALDPQTGAVWANDHGPLGGDELYPVEKGEFHGWPRATYGADYRTGERFTPDRTLEDAVSPVAVWTPAVAPSGLAFYTGDRFPDWYGNLFSGGLVGQDVRRIVMDGSSVAGQETIPIAERVRAVKQGPDGLLYVLTDEEDGALVRIEPSDL